jgi:predicted transcriptional regulator
MKESPREVLRFLTRSDTRVTLLRTLITEASFTRSELQNETGIPRSTVSRILNEFRDRGLVSRAGQRYEVTPFGGFLAERLHSVFDSIEAVQGLQTLLTQLSDTNPDVTFLHHSRCEILTPTASDPGAPTRRFADLLHAASHVRLLVPKAIPVLFDVDSPVSEGTETLEVVVPHTALPVKRDESPFSRELRDVVASGDVTVFAYDGDVPYLAGLIDDIAVVGLTDDAGTVQGYIETSDETVRFWTEATVETYTRNASRVNTTNLTE